MFVCIYLLLAGFPDVLLSLEERPDVHGLASPQVSVNRPVKGEFEGAAVQGTMGEWLASVSCVLE